MGALSRTELVGSLGVRTAGVDLGGMVRFIPEPKSSLGSTFRGALNGMSSLVKTGVDGLTTALPTELTELINKQIEVQLQMQMVSLISNLEKSKHEMEMAAIRNIRVG